MIIGPISLLFGAFTVSLRLQLLLTELGASIDRDRRRDRLVKVSQTGLVVVIAATDAAAAVEWTMIRYDNNKRAFCCVIIEPTTLRKANKGSI